MAEHQPRHVPRAIAYPTIDYTHRGDGAEAAADPQKDFLAREFKTQLVHHLCTGWIRCGAETSGAKPIWTSKQGVIGTAAEGPSAAAAATEGPSGAAVLPPGPRLQLGTRPHSCAMSRRMGVSRWAGRFSPVECAASSV
ncbi:hypothetical protein Vretifemale_4364 [Volvox reticuliferus]|uniref:Uncharacterized protein n=1 Tax=Volvox reticuliferus TaxID=1737510 RepID=A0A8J4C2P9_9CHLO|nr:hypothetical protein Vretifemale_4364 [Volvox reticuliferus]